MSIHLHDRARYPLLGASPAFLFYLNCIIQVKAQDVDRLKEIRLPSTAAPATAVPIASSQSERGSVEEETCQPSPLAVKGGVLAAEC